MDQDLVGWYSRCQSWLIVYLCLIPALTGLLGIPLYTTRRRRLGRCHHLHLCIDASPPFGLRSTAKLLNAKADALEWIYTHLRIKFLSDDTITIECQGTEECVAPSTCTCSWPWNSARA